MKNQSIFCFSITDYGNDITVGKDHLMVQFAKHNNVVMFNLSGSRTPSITRRYDLNRLFRKVLKWFLLPKKLNNIIIVYPIRFPFIGNRVFGYGNPALVPRPAAAINTFNLPIKIFTYFHTKASNNRLIKYT